jgi:hypothetical protein
MTEAGLKRSHSSQALFVVSLFEHQAVTSCKMHAELVMCCDVLYRRGGERVEMKLYWAINMQRPLLQALSSNLVAFPNIKS